MVELLSHERKVKGKSYLEILEVDKFLGQPMKLKIFKEYFRRLKKS